MIRSPCFPTVKHLSRPLWFACLLAAATAQADDSLLEAIQHGKPMTNFRLRYENVDQGNRSETGKALTLRSLVGWQTAAFHDFSLGVQLIDVAKFVDDYDERDLGLPQSGRANYPIIGYRCSITACQKRIFIWHISAAYGRFPRGTAKAISTSSTSNTI